MLKLMLLAMLFISIASVNAWTYIESTDGSVSGWSDTEDAGDNKPDGCTSRSYYAGKCTEFCIDDEIFRNCSCRDRFPDATRNDDTVITWSDYPRPSRCRAENSEIPEFGTIGAAMILVGAGLYAMRKRKNVRPKHFEGRDSWTDLERDNEYMEKIRAELNDEQ